MGGSRGRGETRWWFNFDDGSIGSCDDKLDFDEVRSGLVVGEVEESNDVSCVRVTGESNHDEGPLVGDVEARWEEMIR